MQERHVEVERGHRQQHLAILIGGLNRLDVRVQTRHIRGQTTAGRQKRQAHTRGTQAPLEHAFVEFHQLQLTRFTGLSVVGFERNGIQGDKTEHQLLDLARRAEHADFRPAVSDHGQVLDRRTKNFTDNRHGLAARAPATETDGHAIA